LHEAALTLGMILHRYDLTPETDYRLRISESITLKPKGFRLSLRKRAASSRLQESDTEIRRSA
jgi:cytochrome P450/NADPH-cytochrome P450 reductase